MSFEYLSYKTRAAKEFEAKIPDEFQQLLATDPVVRAHYYAWLSGDFPSFERMLLTLVVLLATEKNRLMNSIAEAELRTAFRHFAP